MKTGHMTFNRITKLAAIAMALVIVLSCNKMIIFRDSFISFVAEESSSTYIDAAGDWTGSYKIRYTGEKPSEPITVSFGITAGDGLVEGTDYELVTTGGHVSLLPGVFEQSIKIHWLSHTLDEIKDNSLTISLLSADGVRLGYPGPSELMKSITIKKYNN